MPSGANAAPIPGFIEFCHPTEREHAPSGDEWIHEVKFDGYRIQVRRTAEGVNVFTRRGIDWTDEFAHIARAAERVKATSFIIDAEAIVEDAHGVANWHALKRSLGTDKVRGYAFDLLYLNGRDLRAEPLMARKRELARLLKLNEVIFAADHFETDGNALFKAGCRMGLEGIVSKKRNAPYHSGRSESWIKVKCKKGDSFPVVAFVEKLGAKPRRIASLYIGRRENGKLLYAGKVQTGYTLKAAQEVRERLDPFITRVSPLSVPVKKPKATWVKPDVLAEVEYSALTEDGMVRAAVFKGLRDDLALPKHRSPPVAPKVVPRTGVPRENILQLLPDAVVPSKDELARYWKRVGKQALNYLAHRPLKLVRHTRGTTFYHKGKLPPIPQSVHQLRIQKREGGEGVRLWVDSVDGLLGLVEIGAVELHPWNATVNDFEHADQIIIDLDPGDGVEWNAVTDAALAMRDIMTAEGLSPWPKLTGGKGIHLVAPLTEHTTHDAAHAFARRLVGNLASRDPRLYILAAQASRRGRIFLDYLRNGRGTTAIGTYSPRARVGFPVAARVDWKAIERGIAPDAFTMKMPPRR